jgi:hypothetical protein
MQAKNIPSSPEEGWRREARARQGEASNKGAGVVLVKELIIERTAPPHFSHARPAGLALRGGTPP